MSKPGTCITIGNFDGVHLGHQFLIYKTIDVAKTKNLESLVLTFDPHPQSFLNPSHQPLILTSINQKLDLIKNLGVDEVEILEFNQAIANLDAVDFVKQILIQKYSLKHLVIGHDFAFGKNRSGNYKLLLKLSKQLDFAVTKLPKFEINGVQPSSHLIRELLQKGKVDRACQLLGRSIEIES